MVRDAGDATEGVVGVVARGVHLADDRVFGPGNGGERGHRGVDAVAPMVSANRLQRSRRIRQPQFCCLGE
jgi:hypothetical protein